ncbi:sensor histidine kinase [Ornithinibacillus bavariensis]|uniref:histidine kinase n=1 Tax=Ornithinibacillus bavariensis TaxID=545502 RepID=A0A919XA75_9BACI|nr:HAMP domain-containing sensor histidine kinase [Ornithinibacillus bavariensis]GIO28714.1 two-component sensor histidine kinase [Ornithinibacillus bavariensis]
MGTRWKSSIFIILTCSVLFVGGFCGIILLSNNGWYYAQKDYFHTEDFQYGDLEQFKQLVVMFELNDVTLEEAKEKITVTKDEIEEYRYSYGNLEQQIESIKGQYEDLIQQAIDNDAQQVADAYIRERDNKINDITKNFESDDYVKDKIIKDREKELETYFIEIESYRPQFEEYKTMFQYYLKDPTNNLVYTNLDNTGKKADVNQISDETNVYVESVTLRNGDMFDYNLLESEESLDMLGGADKKLEGRIGVPNVEPQTNTLIERNEHYKKNQLIIWIVISLSILALILSLIIAKKAKKTRAEVSNWRRSYNKLPIDVRVGLLGVSSIFTVLMFFSLVQAIYYFSPGFSIYLGLFNLMELIVVSIGLAITVMQINFLLVTLKDWKNFKNLWEQCVSYKLYLFLKREMLKLIKNLKEAFLDQTTGTQLIFIFGMVFILGLMGIMVFLHPIFLFFYILILVSIGIPLGNVILKNVGFFNRIVENTNELAAGNLSKDLEITGNTALATLAENINVLKQGVKHSQSEQAKSERLKTELITNVSHDLRTPLTSIITYTELLKEKQKMNDESAAYLEIIDRKSKRLKVLIEDLFEVSKMASGNIELKKEKVDLVQLLQQALGEYDDMIHESSLQFRVTHIDPPVHAIVDGQKLWRVFDNLIGNILKYSMENSRVYINLSVGNGHAIIAFKNVSKYELSENSDELFERFKRGDTSRHTEGSGLGLAIAQSIIELHNGQLEIEIDGDLFKIIIFLPIEE